MNHKFIPSVVVLFTILCSCAVSKTELAANEASQTEVLEVHSESIEPDYMLLAFEDMMKTTSFTALVQHTEMKSYPIEDLDKEDDYAEKRVQFSVRVIEAFHGGRQNEIKYEMIVDITEEEVMNTEPVVICLCEKDGVLFWPGVGSVFPNKSSVITKAKELERNGVFDESNCFED